MKRQINPVKQIGGTLAVPGDKSIAHRAVLLSLLSRGPIEISNFPDNLDCGASLRAVQQFGVAVNREDTHITLTPPETVQISPDTIVDCGNSGTTVRLLAGILAGSNNGVILSGDESLSSRPMKRIVDPLKAMGAEIFDTEGHLPLTVHGKTLLPYEYQMPIPSAQVKSSLLLAGLASGCSTTIREEVVSRDHTEILLQQIGEGLTVREIKPVLTPDPIDPRKKKMVMPEPFKREIILGARASVAGGTVDIPGDFSTAACFWTAAAISGGSVTVTGVGLNPTRTALMEHLRLIGCKVEITDRSVIGGEARGTVTVTGGKLKSRKIAGESVVGMIDEIPLVAVMAAFADGTTVIRDAGELRYKESDRLQSLADNLSRMGVKCGMLEDGIAIEGRAELPGADFASFGDHRIAMAFSVAALALEGPSSIDDDSVVAVSCPGFYTLLDSISS